MDINITPFTDVWFKDCYHMSLLPAVIYIKGNADSILFNQFFKYIMKDEAITFSSFDYQNVYDIMKTKGIQSRPMEKAENICELIDEELNNGNVIIVGVDNYYESIRKDYFQKKHSGHSVLVYGVNRYEKKYKIIEQPFFYSTDYNYYEISFDELSMAYLSFLKKKDENTFFYNDLTFTTRIDKLIPSVCTITIGEIDFLPIDVEARNQYTKSIVEHKKEILESLDSILKYKDMVTNIYNNCNQENNKNLLYIKELSELINNKTLEHYLYSLLYPYQISNQKLLKQTVKKWSEIRTMFSKYMFSGNRNENHIRKIEENSEQIYRQEISFYSNTL